MTVSRVREALDRDCLVTSLTVRGSLRSVLARFSDYGDIDYLAIRYPSTTSHRVFRRRFWVIYRRPCIDRLVDFLIDMLDPEVYGLPPRYVIALVTHALHGNGVREDIVSAVRDRLRLLFGFGRGRGG